MENNELTLEPENVNTSNPAPASEPVQNEYQGPTKFCKHCGQKIPEKAVICTKCGCQVEEMQSQVQQPSININNVNTNTNTNTNTNNNANPAMYKKPKNKWVAFFLALFLGYIGAHKFYEGKIGMGLLYLFTGGLFGIGAFINAIGYLFKPNPYYV